MRGATLAFEQLYKDSVISTHTPHAGRDLNYHQLFSQTIRFLLTRPMRGATIDTVATDTRNEISTHTPHAGRDVIRHIIQRNVENFYSHAPCGARPCFPHSH